MKKISTMTIALLFALTLSSSVLAGCAGCGTQNENNTNDMVESTPANAEDGVLEGENTFQDDKANDHNNGGNTNNSTISNDADSVVDENAGENNNVTDSNGNPITSDGNLVNDAGNAVEDAADNIGNAAKDVVDGVGNGVKALVE